MDQSNLMILYIGLGLLILVLSVVNLYWGTFLILLTQPLFMKAFAEGAGFGPGKVLYGVLFAIWFAAWAIRKLGKDAYRPEIRSAVKAPALAFGVVLGISIVLGLAYGSRIGDIVRDLSQYVGYLAVLPLLDLVQTPKQAKRLIIFLALLGLPAYVITDIFAAGQRQGLFSSRITALLAATAYWGPIEGALWAVAVSFQGFAVKLLVWVWLLLKAALSIYSGIRAMFLVLIISAATAFLVSGQIARRRLARYMIPVLLIMIVGGVLADLSGMVNLPLSAMTRERYSTLISERDFTQDRSMEGRFQESRDLFRKFLQNPVTGIGLGHGLNDPTVPGGYNFWYHNGYLASLMKFGVIGTFIFAWYFIALIRQSYKIGRNSDRYFVKVMALGVVIWLIPALAGSWAVNSISDRGFTLTVGVMAGLLPALASSQNSKEEKS